MYRLSPASGFEIDRFRLDPQSGSSRLAVFAPEDYDTSFCVGADSFRDVSSTITARATAPANSTLSHKKPMNTSHIAMTTTTSPRRPLMVKTTNAGQRQELADCATQGHDPSQELIKLTQKLAVKEDIKAEPTSSRAHAPSSRPIINYTKPSRPKMPLPPSSSARVQPKEEVHERRVKVEVDEEESGRSLALRDKDGRKLQTIRDRADLGIEGFSRGTQQSGKGKLKVERHARGKGIKKDPTANNEADPEDKADLAMRALIAGAIKDIEITVNPGDERVDGLADDIRLMPHQVKGTKWMKRLEEGDARGGILADDMGLGKTVQTITRIVESLPTAADREAGHTCGTLIVCPLSVMEQWATEICTKTQPGLLKVTTYHGPDRAKTRAELEEYDVVITTFHTMASDCPNTGHSSKTIDAFTFYDMLASKGALLGPKTDKVIFRSWPVGPLYQVNWLRLVLDEAHTIKNPDTAAAKAATALASKYRWCLTGTPIQNGVQDLYSLFRFLRVSPLNDWKEFSDRVKCPLNARGSSEKVIRKAIKALHDNLTPILLRRAKDTTVDGKPLLSLPGRFVHLVPCTFDADEQSLYNAVEAESIVTFNKFLRAGTVMKNITCIFAMLTRLRQACDHPVLVTEEEKPPKSEDDNFGALPGEDEASRKRRLIKTLIRPAEEVGVVRLGRNPICQICFVPVVGRLNCQSCDDKLRQEMQSGTTDHSSAKIRTLLKLLIEIRDRGQDDRTIVFSQFTSFFNIIEPFLLQAGIGFVRYDGKMDLDARLDSLAAIRAGVVPVILISFKAGGTGLNLTCCNNVVLLDMWWNPALEEQAFDRAHRMGQTRNVNIYKFLIHGTIEDRILARQDIKRSVAKAALTGIAEAVMKLTEEDLKALFKRSAEEPPEGIARHVDGVHDKWTRRSGFEPPSDDDLSDEDVANA